MLQFQPSLSARSLAGRRSYLIGLVYENPSSNYLVELQHGAMARCRQEKFRLFVHQCSGRGEERSARRLHVLSRRWLFTAGPGEEHHGLFGKIEAAA